SGGTVNFLTNLTLATLTLSGGALSGPAMVTVLGLFTWTGGSLSGTGRTLALGGIAMSGGEHGLDTRVLENAATATPTRRQVSFGGNGVWNNLAGSTLLIQSDAAFGGFFGASGTLQNAGVISKQSTVGTTPINVALNNTGAVEVLSGTLSLGAGGTSSGSFAVAEGATLQFR